MSQVILVVGVPATLGGLFCAILPSLVSRTMKNLVRPLLGEDIADIYSVRVVRVFGILIAMVGAGFIATVVV